MSDATKIPISIAAHVVAAGVYGNNARVTVVLTPIYDESGAYNLVNWPKEAQHFLANVDLDVIPLGANQSWRNADFKNIKQPLHHLSKVYSHDDSDALTKYWQAVMGDDGNFSALQIALDPKQASKLKDPLDSVMRDPEPPISGADGEQTPDIHGTWRSKAVAEHSFERTRHIAGRLRGVVEQTRLDAKAEDSMTKKVQAWRETPRPLPSPHSPSMTAFRIAALTNDEQAWHDLIPSRQRADKLAVARRTYQNPNTSPQNAIAALTGAHNQLLNRTPLMSALRAGAPPTFPPLPAGTPPPPPIANPRGEGVDMAEALAAYRLASRTPTGDVPIPPASDPPSVEFARRRLFALQSNPSLGRLFLFVLDFQCLTEDLVNIAGNAWPYDDGSALDSDSDDLNPAVLAALPIPEKQSAGFLLLSLNTGGSQPRLWTTAKFRTPVKGRSDKAGHFMPCTREEIDARVAGYSTDDFRALAIAEQIDGIVDLGQRLVLNDNDVEPRYDLLTLDAITTTASDGHKTEARAENALTVQLHGNRLPPQVKAALSDNKNATQRGGGLALADRWRQLHAVSRQLESRGQRENYSKTDVVLDASDLTVAYKLDVGVRSKNDAVKRNRWHTLMHRTVEYSPTKGTEIALKKLNDYITGLYPNLAARQEADDGQLQVPAALRDWSQESTRREITGAARTWTTAFTEEIIGAWRGDPLGLACGIESYTLSPYDLRIDMTYRLPSQTDSGGSAALIPPPLRFGWRYHVGLRAMFTGGVTLPLSRALGHYERDYRGDLVLPAANIEGRGYLRHERIDAPTIAIPDWMFGTLAQAKYYTKVTLNGRFPVPQAGRMVVRSFDDPSNRRTAGVPEAGQENLPGVGFDRRVLLAPVVALDFAALHDAFRDKTGSDIERNVKLCEPRVLRKPENENDPDSHIILGEEASVPEFVPVSSQKPNPKRTWDQVNVAWRPYTVRTRPRGGLRSIDYRAAWGGLPVYRASLSVGAVEPLQDQPVAPTPALMTDEGEILHRTKGEGTVIFQHDKEKRRTIVWSAAGVLPGDKGQIERSGAAVFRLLPADRKDEVERQPYYPDPAAIGCVVEVTVGTETQLTYVPVYADAEPKGPAAKDYPNAIPVVLDVVRGGRKKQWVTVNPKLDYAAVPNTVSTASKAASITTAHVTVTLGPGEQANIRAWFVPSENFLAYMWAATETLTALAVVKGMEGKGITAPDIDSAFVDGLKILTSISLGKKPSNRSGDDPAVLTTALGGLPIPDLARSRELAKKIRESMLKHPLPEIAAVTEIEAVHAVDLPQQDPKAEATKRWALLRATSDEIALLLKEKPTGTDPLYDPKNWTLENQMAGATEVLIDGTLTIHGPSTGAVEIRARGTKAARGHFDDAERGRSREDRARGLWPKPDSQNYMLPNRLFGFMPVADGTVRFDEEMITLLRIEGFGPEVNKIGLLDFQRKAEALEDRSPNPDDPLRAQRPPSFPDACARYIEIFAVAISRHASALRTRYDEIPEMLSRPTLPPSISGKKGEAIQSLARFWLSATVRPPRAVPQTPIPSFKWHDSTPTPSNAKLTSVSVKRSTCTRVRLKRSWFVTGEGERLGVVIWPPNLFGPDIGDIRNDIVKPPPKDRIEINLRTLPPDGSNILELQDADMGPGGGWVTRWAADPTRERGSVQGWLLSKDNFPNVITRPADFGQPPDKQIADALLVENVLMPVPIDADAQPSTAAQPPGGFMAVSLITYAPRFDPEQEIWYADLDISPCGAVYPFVRLGLVRFQPHAPRTLQVSEPVVEWTQIMPERKVSATATSQGKGADEQIVITAVVEGAFSQPGPNNSHPSSSPEQAPNIIFTLLRRRPSQDGEQSGPEIAYLEPTIQAPLCGAGCMMWTTLFKVNRSDYDNRGDQWSIFVEEVDRMRPATYPDEPRYETLNDSHFVDSGPRFAARLPLDNLRIT